MIEELNLNSKWIFLALQWNDNCKEMKRFCGNNCIITYESCDIDDFWLLKVNDILVPLRNYVVKTPDDEFIIISPKQYEKYFIKINN